MDGGRGGDAEGMGAGRERMGCIRNGYKVGRNLDERVHWERRGLWAQGCTGRARCTTAQAVPCELGRCWRCCWYCMRAISWRW